MEISDDKIHDFRKGKLTWGWNGLSFSMVNETPGNQTAEMCGLGKGIKEGDFIYSSHGDMDIIWLIDRISYHQNPRDMFDANLSYMGVPA